MVGERLFQVPQQVTPAQSGGDSGALFGWVLSICLAGIVVAIVARPLVLAEVGKGRRKSDGLMSEAGRARLEGLQEQAQAERQSLTDLEFDREIGIIEERDYDEFKEASDDKLAGLSLRISRLESQLQRANQARVGIAGPQTPKTVARNSHSNSNSNSLGPVVSPGSVAAPSPSRLSRKGPSESDRLHLKAAVKEKLKCSECATPFKPGDRFCQHCQAPLPILCLNCGKEITENDRFCAKCGAAVNT